MSATHLIPLSFATLDRLADGQMADAVNRAIEQVVADLKQWGRDGKARKVILEVSLKLKPGGQVEAVCVAKAQLPGEKPKPTRGYIETGAKSLELLFNSSSAANPDQLSLPFDPPAEPAPAPEPAKKKGRKAVGP